MSQITVFVEDSGDRTSDFKSFSAEVNVPESPDCSSLSKTTSDRNALLKRFSNDIFADTSCESEFPSVSITNKNPFDGKIINFVPLASSACGGREFVAKKVGKIRTDIISMRAELSKWKVAKRNKKIDFIQRQTSFTHSVNQTILASESDTEEEESEESSSSSDESEAEKDSTASESDSSVFSNHKRKSKRAALSDSEDTDDTAESNDTSQTSEEDTSVRKPKCRKVLDFSQASDDARDDGDDLLDDIFELTQLKEFKPKLNLDDLNSHPGEVVLNAYYYAYSKAKKVSERKKLPIPACKVILFLFQSQFLTSFAFTELYHLHSK